MQVKTIVSILAVSTALAFAGPSFAQTTINGVEVSADDLPKVQERCAEILASAATDSPATETTDSAADAAASESAAAAAAAAPTPQVNAAAEATSTFDLETLDAESCATVPAAAM